MHRSPGATASRIELTPMPQLAEARSKIDDWTGTKDAASRRRAQTRLNTRAYPSRTQELYSAKDPLLRLEDRKESRNTKVVFPLCPDHLITLLQYNVLRALAVNRTLISGILATPLDCGEETIHVTSCPADPERLLPASLLPTALQQTVLHGDWIDIFPCAKARDTMILAAGTFDEDELWADCIGGLFEGFPDDEVERRGIIAWSPPGTSRAGRCRRGLSGSGGGCLGA
ncbi:hypothetical protein PG988_006473 [Apiospora saccharicola]